MFVRGLRFLTIVAVLAGCATSRPEPRTNEAAAIARVLREDDALGAERNHACETMSLSEAIRGYVRSLAALDFSGCPGDFVDAFTRHREAWEASLPFFAAHDDLRGEMHELFERIRSLGGEAKVGLETAEARIWSTWGEVEDAVARH